MRNELEAALQQTTDALSQATRLLALVSAPSLEAMLIRHVEVLLLQPRVVIVVVITSSGDVTKRMIELEEPADPRARRLGAGLSERDGRRATAGRERAAPPVRGLLAVPA